MNTNDVLTKLIAEIRKHLIPTILDRDYDEWEKGKDAGLQQAIDIAESLQQEQPVTKELSSNLEHWLAFFGCPEENIEKCATQISQGYGAIRFLEGVQHGAEAVNELAKQEQPEVDLDALVNEAFDKYSSIDGYGQLAVSFNRAELYSFIKKITRKEE